MTRDDCWVSLFYIEQVRSASLPESYMVMLSYGYLILQDPASKGNRTILLYVNTQVWW